MAALKPGASTPIRTPSGHMGTCGTSLPHRTPHVEPLCCRSKGLRRGVEDGSAATRVWGDRNRAPLRGAKMTYRGAVRAAGTRFSRTFGTKIDAEAWLVHEKGLLDQDTWSPRPPARPRRRGARRSPSATRLPLSGSGTLTERPLRPKHAAPVSTPAGLCHRTHPRRHATADALCPKSELAFRLDATKETTNGGLPSVALTSSRRPKRRNHLFDSTEDPRSRDGAVKRTAHPPRLTKSRPSWRRCRIGSNCSSFSPPSSGSAKANHSN